MEPGLAESIIISSGITDSVLASAIINKQLTISSGSKVVIPPVGVNPVE